MERWNGRVALVTGASVGIGAAICKVLVGAGMKVVGAARGVEKIQELSNSLKKEKGSLTAVKCDLTKEEDIRHLFKEIKAKFGGVDVCINNAGFTYNNKSIGTKDRTKGTPTEWKNMMDVNVIAVCLCSKLAIQSMRERGVDDGHIVNVSRYENTWCIYFICNIIVSTAVIP
ncbi:Dehydrogenase/reductase SDR family member 11 [Armadillidium nasatum]|uniref:Dehydrogenase/reductase SDR family member 11 n=1 Tax=Armadillidium nasatum TaxID=96803 RepID=A0A5N5SZM8_9CRUS|nr:Dehydrogenase/reductase SDR family member 11 [Armadillidium nasatum]